MSDITCAALRQRVGSAMTNSWNETQWRSGKADPDFCFENARKAGLDAISAAFGHEPPAVREAKEAERAIERQQRSA